MEELRKLHLQIQNFVEIWKVVDGYENYKVSSLGRVKNVKTGRILKGSDRGNGYLTVVLYKNKKAKTFNVHQLIGKAFLVNPENKRCIDHKDRDRKNNKVSNLRYATLQENNLNKSKYKNNKSGHIGVIWDKKRKSWKAYIRIDGKLKHLGYFDDITIAVQSRKAAVKKYHGEFAPK